jgi:phage N-6-adenine-methyltransferase
VSGRPLSGFAELAVDYSDEWYTPRWVIDALGPFDLDPCAPLVRPFDTAERHLTLEDDGLTSDWGTDRVWLNPPYSQVEAWVRKLARHGRGTALVFARVETAYWHDTIWPHASGVLFPRGRISFLTAPSPQAHNAGHNAGAPSALVAFGPEDAERLSTCPIVGAFRRP